MNLKRGFKRFWILAVVGCLLVSMMSGCTQSGGGTKATTDHGAVPTSGTTDGASAPIQIEYWYAWTDKIQENNEELTALFNETVGKEKGIEVTAVYQGTYADVHQKLQSSHVAGTMPHVSVMEIASTKTFAENKVIEPLSPYIQKDGVDMDDFYPGLLENCKVGDTWYGLPYLRSTPIMYLNTTLLEKAGLDPAGPKTWDELAHYCRTVKEKTGAYGMTMNSYIWVFEAFLLEQGVSVLNADETAVNINTPAARRVFEFFRDLKDEGVIRCVSGDESDEVSADIMNQNCAIWTASTANLTYNMAVAKEKGFEINTCFIPKAESYGVPTGGCNLVIAAEIEDEEKAAAWTFVKWMTDTKQSVYSNKKTGYVTARKSSTQDPEIQALYAEHPEYKVALDQLELYGHGRPMNPGYSEASKEIVALMDAIWVNGQALDPLLPDAEAKINRMLK